MIELKTTTTSKIDLKEICVNENSLMNSDGEIIDIVSILKKAYGDNLFNLSVTSKVENSTEVEIKED